MSPTTKQPETTTHETPINEGFRETVESIAIAFVLAFLFRTFEAEAFVIPTGSMAPTLMGRHYDLECPQCKYPLRVGASEENEDEPGGGRVQYIKKCLCPNCRYELDVSAPAGRDGPLPPSYNGDRIIVSKFPYEFSDPQRWDVAVFRYPATAKVNYIKRIAGLPGETVRIERGDIAVQPRGEQQFQMARKPPHKVLAMLQVVYDEDYRLPWLEERGWPSRWTGEGTPDGFERVDNPHRFGMKGAQAMTWLRYRHWVPQIADWTHLRAGPLPAAVRQEVARRGPMLISDFYDYNSRSPTSSSYDYDLDYLGRHWVGDLALECELHVDGTQGDVTLELVEGGRAHQCMFNLETGAATLRIAGLDDFKPQANTAVRGKGIHRVRFANVDDQLLLWVDDKLVHFSAPTSFGPLPFSAPQRIEGNHDGDWSPASVGARGADVKVDHLRVLRDVYYVANEGEGRAVAESNEPGAVPAYFTGGEFPLPYNSVKFELHEDEFLVLGDNSPKSKDSRLWHARDELNRREYFVKRDLLIGKAMFVYWPHGWAPDWAFEINRFGLRLRLPFYPNFRRMKFIH